MSLFKISVGEGREELMSTQYRLSHDPVFYIMAGFFALVTTALPAVLGQPRFLPIAQTLALFVFLLIPLRQRQIRQAITVIALWLVLQWVTMLLLTWLAPLQVERAINDGFIYRTAYLEWFFGNRQAPGSLALQPVGRLLEVLGILVGSLVSGGLIGIWFLVRALNLAAFGSGALLAPLGGLTGLLAAQPVWTLISLAGYGGFVILLAEPLLTRHWALGAFWKERRTLGLISAALLVIGLLLEIILPGAWRTFFQPTF